MGRGVDEADLYPAPGRGAHCGEHLLVQGQFIINIQGPTRIVDQGGHLGAGVHRAPGQRPGGWHRLHAGPVGLEEPGYLAHQDRVAGDVAEIAGSGKIALGEVQAHHEGGAVVHHHGLFMRHQEIFLPGPRFRAGAGELADGPAVRVGGIVREGIVIVLEAHFDAALPGFLQGGDYLRVRELVGGQGDGGAGRLDGVQERGAPVVRLHDEAGRPRLYRGQHIG